MSKIQIIVESNDSIDYILNLYEQTIPYGEKQNITLMFNTGSTSVKKELVVNVNLFLKFIHKKLTLVTVNGAYGNIFIDYIHKTNISKYISSIMLTNKQFICGINISILYVSTLKVCNYCNIVTYNTDSSTVEYLLKNCDNIPSTFYYTKDNNHVRNIVKINKTLQYICNPQILNYKRYT